MENHRMRILGIVGIIVAVVAFVGMATLFVSCDTVPQGEIAYQVGGGPFDSSKSKIKSDMLMPGRHVTGTLDRVWTFPSNKTLRFQDFKLSVTTLDGKKVTVEGQAPFRFVGERDPALAKEFAMGLGARKYNGKRPGENDKGWRGMLEQLVLPEISATLKEQFGRVYCSDFEPACRAIDSRREVPPADPELVYSNIAEKLQARVSEKLGGEYLQNFRIRMNRVILPREVQVNIDRVTSEQAKTKAAVQGQQTATAEAKVIRIKGEALKKNRELLPLEVARECRGGDQCTIILDASGTGVRPTVNASR